MSLPIVNAALEDRTDRVRSKAIPWEGYGRGGLLSDSDVALVQSAALRKAHDPPLDPDTYSALYVRLLAKLSRADTIQSLLVFLGDLLTTETAPVVIAQGAYGPLVKLIDSPDEFIRLKSLVLLSSLISTDGKVADDLLQRLLSRISSILESFDDPQAQDVVVQCLEGILRQERVRTYLWVHEGQGELKIVAGLLHLLQPLQPPQTLYQLVFNIWLLTFDETIASEIEAKFSIIGTLIKVAKDAIKEKVIRIVIATFVNLMNKAPQANLNAMLVAQLLPYVKSLSHRKWVDEDIGDDLAFLIEQLESSFAGLTTFDEYVTELNSHKLTWSPPHKSDEFWRENATKLNEKGLVRVLVDIISDKNADSLSLAVAANDIAQYVQNTDTGKKHIDDLGAKPRIFELMTHPDADVKYNALVAIQQLMSHPWE